MSILLCTAYRRYFFSISKKIGCSKTFPENSRGNIFAIMLYRDVGTNYIQLYFRCKLYKLSNESKNILFVVFSRLFKKSGNCLFIVYFFSLLLLLANYLYATKIYCKKYQSKSTIYSKS